MASGSDSRQVATRWKPEEAQLRILEEVFRNNGGHSPSTAQILLLTTQLQQYGEVEARNIFFWFENRRRKERAIPAPIFTSPIFNIAPGTVTPCAINSQTISPSTGSFTPTIIVKMQTIITPIDHSTSNTVVSIVDARGRFGLDQHFQ